MAVGQKVLSFEGVLSFWWYGDWGQKDATQPETRSVDGETFFLLPNRVF